MKIAVVTNSARRYMDYVNHLTNSKDTFVFIDTLNKVKGHRFNQVVKLYGYQDIKDIGEILNYIEVRLVKEPIKQKLGFWYWVELILLTPLWFYWRSSDKKSWKDFKSGLIKHEHQWDYENPKFNEGFKYYKCKHPGCNNIVPQNR